MATLESDDSNILDSETVNWRLVVYPILAVALLIAGGFSYYYYQQDQRDEAEAQARAALLQAKTPEELAKVADQFPHTDQATLALLSAADDSFAKRDFPAATADYRRIVEAVDTDAELRDSAQLGLASSLEASGKVDDAINAYLEVARRGDKSPYAPFGYDAAARIYEQRGDKDNERKVLTEAAELNADSQFVKQAQAKLKALNAATQPPLEINPTGNAPVPTPATNTAPTPVTKQKQRAQR